MAKLGKPHLYQASLNGLTRKSTLMQLVGKHLAAPASLPVSELKKETPKSVVTEQLVPKVIQMDEDGRPLSCHETVALQKHVKVVETIPWSTWAEKETKRNPNEIAKMLLLVAIDSLHQNWSWIPPAPLCW